MGKLSDEQAAALAELEALRDGPDDDDETEVWIKNDKGHETRLPASKAGGFLKEHFGIDLSGKPAGAGEGEGGEGGEGGEDKKPAGTGYFSKKAKG